MIIACGIDIGTNSFRLLVAEVQDGRLHPLAHELVTVRLGEGLWHSGRLSSAAMIRAEVALTRFAGTMASFPVHSVRICATHAVRTATNSLEFLQRILSLTGLRVEVLSGDEEARLALWGALSALPEVQLRHPLVLVDVGGGSTEIIRQATALSVPQVRSLPLGAVGLTEEFAADFQGMRTKIRAILDPSLQSITDEEIAKQGSLLVASGGTVTSLAALALGLDHYDAQRVQNYNLSLVKLDSLVSRLTAASPRERNGLPGMAEGRGEIIVAGAIILQELQLALACPSLLVSDAGLLEGILLSGVEGRHRPNDPL
ncbi:MAG: Ppx/GppA family phosphatase [Proteobacteria bacterium]|nr:Ppx/GppA family phosphatase [Pseudomonadota bacterium]MBU4118392.1 Ppx/GppA family phosphatase [Pseudomonadota bacterium]